MGEESTCLIKGAKWFDFFLFVVYLYVGCFVWSSELIGFFFNCDFVEEFVWLMEDIGGVLGLLATQKVWQRRKNLIWHYLLFYLSSISIGIKMLLIYNIEKKT